MLSKALKVNSKILKSIISVTDSQWTFFQHWSDVVILPGVCQ